MMPGQHAEDRVQARNDKRKEGIALFGQNGVLQQLRQMDAYDQLKAPVIAPSGAPSNSTKRQEERKAAKEAKIQHMLEERAIRLATEAAIETQKKQRAASLARNASAPELGDQDLDKQRRRIACKMEMMDFFSGYSQAVRKMTKDQQRVLQAHLHGQGAADLDAEADEDHENSGVQDRLQRVNDMCNRVFEDPT